MIDKVVNKPNCKFINNKLYCVIKDKGIITLVIFDSSLNILKRIPVSRGHKGFLLYSENEDQILLSIDNNLVLIKNNESKVVLRAHSPLNVFWHACRAEDKIIVQEYGEKPTGIYMSEDLSRWSLLVTNIEIDKYSRHFHSITYDPYRGWLIATLGDGNLIRVIFSENLGRSWKPLYKGPWQFVPIVVLKNKLIFGMDSGIAKGGLGIYYPSEHYWDFIFLRWYNRNMNIYAQMNDLRVLNNNLWIAGLGSPQAILVSNDKKRWYIAYMEKQITGYSMYVSVSEGQNVVACTTERRLLLFKKSELKSIINKGTLAMVRYKAYTDRLRGLVFTLKRIFRY